MMNEKDLLEEIKEFRTIVRSILEDGNVSKTRSDEYWETIWKSEQREQVAILNQERQDEINKCAGDSGPRDGCHIDGSGVSLCYRHTNQYWY